MKGLNKYLKKLTACIMFFGFFLAFIGNAKPVFASEITPEITKIGGADVVDNTVSFSHIIVGDTIDLELTITGSGPIDVYFS